MKQQVRIIGGLYRGKKIEVAALEGLRPTPDRVRETLFNWLMKDIRGARCLDAFAGTGALGLEAFSRGASSVVFIEHALTALQVLKKNLSAFNSPLLEWIHRDAQSYLSTTKKTFDLIFLDPPFALDCLPQCLNEIEKNSLLVQGGLVYVESFEAPKLNEMRWRQLRLKQAGRVVYGLYEKI